MADLYSWERFGLGYLAFIVANIVAKTAIVSSALEVTKPEYESFD
jgi:hypothetical protein